MAYIPKSALVVTPHADDATLFAGGTLAMWSEAGCQIMVVRVTQDEKDSFELSIPETIRVNEDEFHAAMKVLGVKETVSLGYRDCELMDAPYGELREWLIRLIRRFKPEIILGFDPVTTDEENPDHLIAARATADAAWSASYPNFHPEHRAEGLEPHSPLGCFYFTRHFVEGETVIDISGVMEKKVAAVLCHRNMLRTMLADQKRRIAASGISIPAIERATLDDWAEHWQKLIFGTAILAAQGTDIRLAERFRGTMLNEEDPLVQFMRSMD